MKFPMEVCPGFEILFTSGQRDISNGFNIIV